MSIFSDDTRYFIYEFLLGYLMNTILRVEGLNKNFTKKSFFQSKSSMVTAVNNVSFSLSKDEILAINEDDELMCYFKEEIKNTF